MIKTNLNNTIQITEAVRIGDVFLNHFICPYCGETLFQAFPFSYCDICSNDLTHFLVSFPEQYRTICNSKRKSKQRISKLVIIELYNSQGGKCNYCDEELDLEMCEVDHINPLAINGTNNHHNLCLACPDCNRVKASFIFNSLEDARLYILNERLKRIENKENYTYRVGGIYK